MTNEIDPFKPQDEPTYGSESIQFLKGLFASSEGTESSEEWGEPVFMTDQVNDETPWIIREQEYGNPKYAVTIKSKEEVGLKRKRRKVEKSHMP